MAPWKKCLVAPQAARSRVTQWLCLLYIGGRGWHWLCAHAIIRTDGENLVFNPSLPQNWTSIGFTIQYRASKIAISINQKSISLSVIAGPAVEVTVYGKKHLVDAKGVVIII